MPSECKAVYFSCSDLNYLLNYVCKKDLATKELIGESRTQRYETGHLQGARYVPTHEALWRLNG